MAIDKFRILLSIKDIEFLLFAIDAAGSSVQGVATRKKLANWQFKATNNIATPAYRTRGDTEGAMSSLHEQIASPEEIDAWLETEMKRKLGEL